MRPPSVLGAPDSPSVHTYHNCNLPTGRSKPTASLPTLCHSLGISHFSNDPQFLLVYNGIKTKI